MSAADLAPPPAAIGKPRQRVAIIALSPIADDPRVRRQGDALAQVGFEVVGLGLDGARSAPPGWTILAAAAAPPAARASLFDRLRHAARLLSVRVRPNFAERLYWTPSPCWMISASVAEIYRQARALEADLWLANDWTALPLAARLARENGGRYVYDTHEFATEEYAEKWKWRLLARPLVCALERRFIAGAAVVSAVSGGIAERLDAMYALPRRCLTIRNTPPYRKTAFRPVGERIRVLYHGLVVAGRGLEAAIDSVALWPPEFDLTIRGPENPAFTETLRRHIRDAGVEDRVHLLPAVPMTELVREAAEFDVGFFALPGHSRHNQFALPNKFFEYVMAGLALCVSDLPEMARLVRQYRLGVLMPRLDPAAIAAAVRKLDRAEIDACKRRALAAAEEMSWECEANRLVDAYRAAMPQPAGD